MAQINLLKQKSPAINFAENLPPLLVKILALLLFVAAAYYGYQFFQLNKVNKIIEGVQTKMRDDKKSLTDELYQRDELLTRQGQLAQLDTLMKGHIYWSQIFLPLAQVTFKQTTINELRMDKDNTIFLRGSVPDLDSLVKFLQVFDLPEVNSRFYDVRLSSWAQSKDKDDKINVKFEVKMRYNPELVNKYKDQNAK